MSFDIWHVLFTQQHTHVGKAKPIFLIFIIVGSSLLSLHQKADKLEQVLRAKFGDEIFDFYIAKKNKQNKRKHKRGNSFVVVPIDSKGTRS